MDSKSIAPKEREGWTPSSGTRSLFLGMIPVTQLRKGTTFQEKGVPFLVLKYEHVKLGRGKANIKVKAKNLKTGEVVEKNFISDSRVEEIFTTKRQLQYLYQDGEYFYFMDPISFEQFEVPIKILKEQKEFLKEGFLFHLLFWLPPKASGEEPLFLELPSKVKLRVEKTTPGLKGDSVVNVYKEAILENGLKIRAPLFINEGEEVVVDSRTKKYIGRAKS